MQKTTIKESLSAPIPNEETVEELLKKIETERAALIKVGKIKNGKPLPEITKDEIPFEIPQNWKWVRVNSLVVRDIKRGKSPTYCEKSNTLVFAQKCNLKAGGINLKLAYYLDENTLSKYQDDDYLQEGDILINSTGTGTLGRVGLFKESNRLCGMAVVPDTHVTTIRVSHHVSPSYMYNYLKCFQNAVEDMGEGSTNQKELKPLSIMQSVLPLPPFSVQMQIVAILDKVFSKLGDVKGILEKQLINSEELFQSKLSSYNYPTKPLGELVEIKTGKLDANAAIEGGQYPFFTCSREIFRIDNYAYDCEAILLAGNNASADFNVKHYKGKFNAYQRTYILTVKDGVNLDYRYLYYQLLNSLKELKKKAVGAGTKFLRMPMIKSFEIPYPENIDDQRKIVIEMDMVNESVNQMKEAYLHKLTCVEELRKSILDKAFHGELLK